MVLAGRPLGGDWVRRRGALTNGISALRKEACQSALPFRHPGEIPGGRQPPMNQEARPHQTEPDPAGSLIADVRSASQSVRSKLPLLRSHPGRGIQLPQPKWTESSSSSHPSPLLALPSFLPFSSLLFPFSLYISRYLYISTFP